MPLTEIAKQKLAALDERGEDDIFEEIAAGVSMREMCKKMNVGHKLWYRWIDSVDGRRGRYESALMEAAHFYADRAVQTAQQTEPATVNADRLKVDTDKWIASKLNQQYDVRQKDIAINSSVNDLHAQAAQLLGDVDDIEDAEIVEEDGE